MCPTESCVGLVARATSIFFIQSANVKNCHWQKSLALNNNYLGGWRGSEIYKRPENPEICAGPAISLQFRR